MYDEIIYVWAVKDEQHRLHHICTKRSTADYLRDWCEAKAIDDWCKSLKALNVPETVDILFEAARIVGNKFTVIEEEVV